MHPVVVADPHLNPEFELLLACCHSDSRLLTSALQQELQWDSAFKLANYHRVLPVLYSRLRDRSDVPASVQWALRARFVAHCQRAMRFSAELAGILKQFEAAGIPVIAQKGPALAQVLYGDPAMREFGDLDLLVRTVDVPPAASSLRELGFEQNLQLSPGQENAYLRSGYEYVFGRGTERNLIELQWSLLPRFYAVDVDVDALFSRSVRCDFESYGARVLSAEDQTLFLCVHAAKHQWAQLGMLRDLTALSQLEIDWDWVLEEARRLGITRILLLSLLLAEELGAELPVVLATLPEVVECRQSTAAIQANVVDARELHPESAAYFRFMLQLRECWQDRARILWRLVVTPSISEWTAVRVPDALFPLYRGVRLFRLLRRAVSRAR